MLRHRRQDPIEDAKEDPAGTASIRIVRKYQQNRITSMDAAEAFRQGLGSVKRAQEARAPRMRESSHESEEHSPRIAHTLAACCRCRQRKTRCDPTLPRCLPCERAGAVCEYYDTTKGKKISRTYVIRLQDKVRALEAELGQYTEEEEVSPGDTEDTIRPGGLVRLDENNESPRFLGPSSGIAMTRLVMEEAKRYTDSRSIRELVPEVRQRRTPAQSPDAYPERKKSYPMISAVPALTLPSRLVTDKLVEVFNQKAQYLFPTLHEVAFAKEIDDVYAGSTDPYKNFVLRMVLAISMQKLDTQYAGLADSYYLAAMAHVETVIRPKDLRTLQCLVLIAQYSLLTPTRTAIYYIVGLATRVCQQLGLTEEKTIVQGVSQGLVDPLQLDMRRRLSWIVLSMELGLAHSLGRPSGFATDQDHVDVGFFQALDDEYITADGILRGPPSEKKIMAVHFYKMRLLQAEIRRTLYQRKRPEPKSEEHPWFAQMEKKLEAWLEASPPRPHWSKPWYYIAGKRTLGFSAADSSSRFNGRYNTMIVFLYRPSPQVPKPSLRAAMLCYDASAYNIKMQNSQMDNPSVDITWIFVLSLFMALNTILWTISYPEVRSLHGKEDLEEHIKVALSIILRCTERWPGSTAAHELYSKLARACLKSYDMKEGSHPPSSLSANSPASLTDANSPNSEFSSSTTGSLAYSQKAAEPGPTFGYVFDQAPDQSIANEYHQSLQQPRQPSFRSGSIFMSPASVQTDRRFSYFPPDFTQQLLPSSWDSVPMIAPMNNTPPNASGSMQPQTSVADPTYFMQPSYNFGPHMYADQNHDMRDREGSLSHQQQAELMQSLERDGLNGIDSYLGLSSAGPFFGTSKR